MTCYTISQKWVVLFMNEAKIGLKKLFNIGGFGNLEAIYTLICASKIGASELAEMMLNNTLEERLAVIGCVRLHGGESIAKVVEDANKIILKWQVNALEIAIKSNNYEKFFSYFGLRELVEFSKTILSSDKVDKFDEASLCLIDEEIAKRMAEEVKPSKLDELLSQGRIANFSDSCDFSL